MQRRVTRRRAKGSDVVSCLALCPFLLDAASNQTGAGSRIRTDDLLITNQLLYQLSYAGA